MKIIVLKGRAQCGKSETIGIHLRALLTGNEYPTNEWDGLKDEKKYIVFNGTAIDLCPAGDTADIVKDNIAFIKENPCEVVFTATRTKGGSWNTLMDFVNETGVDLIVKWKPYDDDLDRDVQTEKNKELAKKLLMMI